MNLAQAKLAIRPPERTPGREHSRHQQGHEQAGKNDDKCHRAECGSHYVGSVRSSGDLSKLALRGFVVVLRAIKNRTGSSATMNVRGPVLAPVASVYDVNIVGLGYVGLPTAALLASQGRTVAGFDVREEVVTRTNSGEAHFAEPGLSELVSTGVAAGTLRAFVAPVRARVHLICVPTPITRGREPDLRAVEAASASIANVAEAGDLVVLESTVPPGTTRDVLAAKLEQVGFTPGTDIFVAHAPERILPGAALREVVENARVVGGVTEACTQKAAEFYRGFVRGEVHCTRAEVAETVKLAENAFRDVNIAFANELANVCEHVAIDSAEVVRLANAHPRVNILRSGPGVGGHCIAVDPWFLSAAAPHDTPLVQAARFVNDGRPGRIVSAVRGVAQRIRRPKIACMGLTYKPNIGDLRHSPALEVARMIAAEQLGEVLLVDPHLQRSPLEGLALWDAQAALEVADVAVILVAHRRFGLLAPELFNKPSVLDTVGLLG